MKKRYVCISTALKHAWLHSVSSCIARPHLVTRREVMGKILSGKNSENPTAAILFRQPV